LPPEVFIGLSVETLDQVVHSATLPVDYLGVSPVFATATKTDTLAPWELQGLREARARTDLPLVAIGGIHAGNARAVLEAGADSLALVSALCSAPDPADAARNFRKIFHGE
jgi:thiamine-phosphate pyrophosphorylase